MIEIIYNEEDIHTTEETALTKPKNVKQIGEPKEYKQIFLEDYVHTFLQQYRESKEPKLAILLGVTERLGGKRHLYISGVMPVQGISEKQGKYIFTEKIWSEIYRQCETCFPQLEIMGWMLANPEDSLGRSSVIEQTHRTYFSGADKVFFWMGASDRENSFWGFDGNRFAKQPGYYIYYEKNEPMREFLMENHAKEEMQKEQPDVAMANFRHILKEKQQKAARRKRQVFSYGGKVVIALVMLVGAVTLRNQTKQIRTMEDQMSLLTSEQSEVEEVFAEIISEEGTEESVREEGAVEEVLIEELPGNVTEQPEKETLSEELQTEPKTYQVQVGDTLAKISRDQYGNDDMIEAICSLNQITNGDYIQVGEIILLP